MRFWASLDEIIFVNVIQLLLNIVKLFFVCIIINWNLRKNTYHIFEFKVKAFCKLKWLIQDHSCFEWSLEVHFEDHLQEWKTMHSTKIFIFALAPLHFFEQLLPICQLWNLSSAFMPLCLLLLTFLSRKDLLIKIFYL